MPRTGAGGDVPAAARAGAHGAVPLHLDERARRGLAGTLFPHLVYHLVFTYSNVEAVRMCFSEIFRGAGRGAGEELSVANRRRLDSGIVPITSAPRCANFTVRAGTNYQELPGALAHYGMQPSRNSAGLGAPERRCRAVALPLQAGRRSGAAGAWQPRLCRSQCLRALRAELYGSAISLAPSRLKSSGRACARYRQRRWTSPANSRFGCHFQPGPGAAQSLFGALASDRCHPQGAGALRDPRALSRPGAGAEPAAIVRAQSAPDRLPAPVWSFDASRARSPNYCYREELFRPPSSAAPMTACSKRSRPGRRRIPAAAAPGG